MAAAEISKIKTLLLKTKSKRDFTISDLVVILGMSENSIEAFTSGSPYYKTAGNRRYKKLHVEMFLIKMKEKQIEKRKRSKLHSGLAKIKCFDPARVRGVKGTHFL